MLHCVGLTLCVFAKVHMSQGTIPLGVTPSATLPSPSRSLSMVMQIKQILLSIPSMSSLPDAIAIMIAEYARRYQGIINVGGRHNDVQNDDPTSAQPGMGHIYSVSSRSVHMLLTDSSTITGYAMKWIDLPSLCYRRSKPCVGVVGTHYDRQRLIVCGGEGMDRSSGSGNFPDSLSVSLHTFALISSFDWI
jgi:hypothetical protein